MSRIHQSLFMITCYLLIAILALSSNAYAGLSDRHFHVKFDIYNELDRSISVSVNLHACTLGSSGTGNIDYTPSSSGDITPHRVDVTMNNVSDFHHTCEYKHKDFDLIIRDNSTNTAISFHINQRTKYHKGGSYWHVSVSDKTYLDGSYYVLNANGDINTGRYADNPLFNLHITEPLNKTTISIASNKTIQSTLRMATKYIKESFEVDNPIKAYLHHIDYRNLDSPYFDFKYSATNPQLTYTFFTSVKRTT